MKRRPLVVLDALVVRPRPAGVGRAILDWTRSLAATPRFCDFAVLCTHPHLFQHVLQRSGWRLIPCDGARGISIRKAVWTQLYMPRILKKIGADLLHSLHFIVPLCAPCPTVATVYDLGYLVHRDTIEEPRRSFYRWIVPRSLKSADAVTCISEATAEEVRARFPAVTNRLWITPLGVPSWIASRSSPSMSREEAAPFLFVGTREPRKNLERLVRAYRAFRHERHVGGLFCPELVIVGARGWKDRQLRREIAALSAEGVLHVKGYASQDELWRQYSQARALLMPSLHEGFGLPILEAMAAGIPVLTSNRGAMAEVAGDAALLVNPFDEGEIVRALHQLVDDISLTDRLVARGKLNLARWSWDQTAEATCDLYRRILDEGVSARNK